MNNKIIYPNPSTKSLSNNKITESKLEDFIFGGKADYNVEEDVPQKRTLQPAWVDEDDCEKIVTFDKKNKYHSSNNEENISVEEYKKRLRNDFLKIHGNATWAQINFEEQDANCPENQLLRNSQNFGKKLSKGGVFRPHELSFHKCPDANLKNRSKGPVTALQFHPRARLFMIGSSDKSVNFFGYGEEETTEYISKLYADNFAIKHARFIGHDNVVATARSSSFLCYDLQAEKAVFIPPTRGIRCTLRGFSESPNNRLLAFHSSTRCQAHLFDFKSKEYIKTLTKNGDISASVFMGDDKILLNGDDDSVWVWDIRMHKCCHKFVDRGCVKGTAISISPDCKYVVCGSSTGIVNMYSSADCLNKPTPSPLHTFSNLVTSCSHLVFDSSSSLLSILSCHKTNAIRLVHVAGRSVFNNFPAGDMGVCTVADFSPTTGLLAAGDIGGRVRMIRLESFDM